MKPLLTIALLIFSQIWSCGSGAAAHVHSVTLQWDAPVTPPPFIGYYVYRSRAAIGSVAYVRLNSSPLTNPTFVDTTVQRRTTYTYYVTAVDGTGAESAKSNLFSASIPNP